MFIPRGSSLKTEQGQKLKERNSFLGGGPRDNALTPTRFSWGPLKDLTVIFSIFTRGSGGAGTDLFTLIRIQGNSINLSWESFRLDIRKRFFTQMVAEHWNKLPRRQTSGAKEIPAKRKDYHPEHRRLNDSECSYTMCISFE